MDKDNELRHRGLSIGSSPFANLPKYSSTIAKRSNSTVTGLAPRSIRIVVLGVGGVGKTAMTVRFLTKRFIGDYDPNLETIYRHVTIVDEQLVNFEIMDTAGQCENSLPLEDKCKWGESFIFVYDVTDRHSYDELTRLKFIASYTHSRFRVNFTPCWVLVGNKADLADRERMVSVEEGQGLARDLGCHIFREISVKESRVQSSLVFEDLWRYFIRLSPRSPSSSHRRKYSLRIKDRISVIDSTSCECETEALKDFNSTQKHQNMNEIFVRTVTSTLRRQISPGILPGINYKHAKQYLPENQQYTSTNSICSPIPENINEDEEEDSSTLPSTAYQRSRRNAIVNNNNFLKEPSRISIKNKTPKSDRLAKLRSDNIFDNLKATSNSSLDCLSSFPNIDSSSTSDNIGWNQSNSNASVFSQESDTRSEGSVQFRSIDHRQRRPNPRRFNKARLTHSFRHNLQPVSGLSGSCEVTGC